SAARRAGEWWVGRRSSSTPDSITAAARRPGEGRRGRSATRTRPRYWIRCSPRHAVSGWRAGATGQRWVRRPLPGTGPAEQSAVSAAGDRAYPPAPRFAPAQGPVVLRSPALLTRRASGVAALPALLRIRPNTTDWRVTGP